MADGSIGFLEHLYQGSFRADLLVPEGVTEFSRAERLADRLRELLKGFDARAMEASGKIPDELMAGLKRLGIFGIIVPEEYGGLDFTTAEYLRFTELMAAMDSALILVPLAHLSIGIMGLLLYGSEEQKRRYLPKAASGEMIFSFALTEPAVGSDARSVQTLATPTEDGSAYLLSGTKTYITNANYSQGFMVFARLDGEREGRLAAFVVERDWPGLSIGRDMPKMGMHTSSTAAVKLREVRVPRENLVGTPGEGFKIAMTILNYGRLALGAGSSGVMNQSVTEMLARASSRKQFGVPILDFELIQEKIARSHAHAYAATAMTYFTASLLEQDPTANVAIESSHTKLYGTTRAWDTLYDAVQTAGGSGYLSTLPFEKRMRDFRVTTIFEGTTEIHSVYPPLGLFRSYGKELEGKSPIAQWLFLRRLGRTAALREWRESHPTLQRAVQTAQRSERHFRSLLRTGFLRYRSKIIAEELYLRRMTHLSLSLFWLVSAVGYLKARYPNGDFPQAELYLIDYLTAEAEEFQQTEARSRRSAKERTQANIVGALAATAD